MVECLPDVFKPLVLILSVGRGREAAKLAFIDLVMCHDAHSEGVVLMKSLVW